MLRHIKKIVRYAFIELWLQPHCDLKQILYRNLHEGDFFIQIGSNDGTSYDPIHDLVLKKHLQGVLVEPVKSAFYTLRQTYRGRPGLKFENSAITERSGARTFYRLTPITDQRVPLWHTLIGSFDKDIILAYKCRIPDIEKYLITEDINCVTFRDLIRKYSVRKLDLLHIDAEGYDFRIIKSIDFNEIKPRMLFFEHQTIYMNWMSRYFTGFLQYIGCMRRLKREGYRLVREGGDTLAVYIRPAV